MSKRFPLFSAIVATLSATFMSSSAPVAADAPGNRGPATAQALTHIASNFDASTTLIKTWGSGDIPPSASPDRVGAFRFICGAGQLSYDDPIVYPGQPGRSHLHQFYGNTAANAHSTFASLRASGDSTCNNMGNGTAANRSAYWMPAMLDGKGNVVMPDLIQVYYKRDPVTPGSFCDPADAKNVAIGGRGQCLGIPNAVRFIQGFNMITGKHSVQPGWYACRGKGAANNVWKQSGKAMSEMSAVTCPPGSQLEAAISSLKCWNGQLDSPDHISHLADMVRTGSGSKCPATHPYYLAQFTISAFYSIKDGDDVGLWSLSSDHMYPKLPRGATLHFDYFEGWDESVKAMWVDHCIGRKLNCSGGDLGNGQQLKGAAKPKYGWKNPERLVPVPKGGMRM